MKFKHGSSQRADPLWMCLALGTMLGGALIAAVLASGSRPNPTPTFTLQLEIMDGETGEPVPATVLLDSQLLAEGVTALERVVELVPVTLDPRCLARHGGDAAACSGTRTLEVRAPGYETWTLSFRANLELGQEIGGIRGPVRLQRIPSQAKSAP